MTFLYKGFTICIIIVILRIKISKFLLSSYIFLNNHNGRHCCIENVSIYHNSSVF